jgi:lysine 2,3-aminomutase
VSPGGAGSLTEAFYADPIRHYMIPVFSDRRTDWPSHPHAARDSLHEHDMWATEGLTHRYPTKVLAELLPTCPQYCGHCTRMDLVGNSTPVIEKLKFTAKPNDRLGDMMDYLRRTPSVRDVVVSGGDVANMPWPRLEAFLTEVLSIENIRDIRLATKALIGLPQHWLQPDVVDGVGRVAQLARSRGVSLAMHTHANHANSITPIVAEASRAMLDAGLRDVRNQGVLLDGVNADPHALLDLCFRLLDGAQIMPYYFYMCDMIPFSEHWRVSVADAQRLQHHIMGYLPGFATPRIVCDVPFVGKRWVHQLASYDTERGIGGIFDISNHNSLGGAREVGLRSRYDRQLHEGRLYLNQPALTYLPKTTVSFYLREELNPPTELTDPFDVSRKGFSVQQEKKLQDRYVLTYGYKLERVHTLTPIIDGTILDEQLTVSPVIGTLTRETRDDILDSSRGTFLSQSCYY